MPTPDNAIPTGNNGLNPQSIAAIDTASFRKPAQLTNRQRHVPAGQPPLKTRHGGTETHSDAPATNPQPPPDQECDAAAALAAFSCLAFFEAS